MPFAARALSTAGCRKGGGVNDSSAGKGGGGGREGGAAGGRAGGRVERAGGASWCRGGRGGGGGGGWGVRGGRRGRGRRGVGWKRRQHRDEWWGGLRISRAENRDGFLPALPPPLRSTPQGIRERATSGAPQQLLWLLWQLDRPLPSMPDDPPGPPAIAPLGAPTPHTHACRARQGHGRALRLAPTPLMMPFPAAQRRTATHSPVTGVVRAASPALRYACGRGPKGGGCEYGTFSAFGFTIKRAQDAAAAVSAAEPAHSNR